MNKPQKQAYTKEPWIDLSPDGTELDGIDYARAVSCVNACAGLTEPKEAIHQMRVEIQSMKEQIMHHEDNLSLAEAKRQQTLSQYDDYKQIAIDQKEAVEGLIEALKVSHKTLRAWADGNPACLGVIETALRKAGVEI